MARLSLSTALGLSLLGATLVGSPSARADDTASPALRPPPASPAPSPSHSPTPILPPPAPAPLVKPPHVIWYGWEPLVAAAGVTAMSLALLRSEPLAGLSLGAILSPITTMTMHELHGQQTKAYVSLGLSYGVMIGGGVLGAELACGGHGTKVCQTYGAVTGVLVGSASALIFDAAVLAWGPPEIDRPATKARLWPSVTPLPNGAAVGLGGTF